VNSVIVFACANRRIESKVYGSVQPLLKLRSCVRCTSNEKTTTWKRKLWTTVWEVRLHSKWLWIYAS